MSPGSTGNPGGTDGAGEVVVAGGGLAGITAALDAADAGHRVTLLERRPRLGGLTHSFARTLPDGSRLVVDNGQHVLLRCFTAYRALLERLGTGQHVHLQPRLEVHVRSPGHRPGDPPRTALLRRGDLPAPLHLLPVLARHRLLTARERLGVARASAAMARLDPAAPATDARSLAAWLDEQGQGRAATAAVWDLLCVATLNARAQDASLALAAVVLQQGLLAGRADGDVGLSRVPLQRLHGDAAAAALDAAGVRVRRGVALTGLRRGGGDRWRVEAGGAAPTTADAVVVALPPRAAERLVPREAQTLAPGWSERLGASPIVDVHLVLDRRALEVPLAAGAGSTAQWVFDRTGPSGLAPGPGGRERQYLVVSVSAADDLVGLPAAVVVDRVRSALVRLHPAVGRAEVVDAFVTREREATFAQAPGSAADRPPAATADPALALAGAWTATGWPATMEGAVRSGHAGAAVALAAVGHGAAPARTGTGRQSRDEPGGRTDDRTGRAAITAAARGGMAA